MNKIIINRLHIFQALYLNMIIQLIVFSNQSNHITSILLSHHMWRYNGTVHVSEILVFSKPSAVGVHSCDL